jgi:hypothetical protein
MKRILIVLLLAIWPSIAGGTDPAPTRIMVAGVSRDDNMFKGGIGSSKWTGSGTVAIEVIAWITPDGTWQKLPCDYADPVKCRRFAHEYLTRTHTYTVVSSDGRGARVVAAPASLSECYGYDGVGAYSGAAITTSAIAADSDDAFADAPTPTRLTRKREPLVWKGVQALIPQQIDSIKHLRVFALRLEGKPLIVVQRSFADYASDSESERLRLIFDIGQIGDRGLTLVHKKANTEDDDERILGTVRMKNGREFLITAVSDPESQSFRIYGIQDGNLKIVFSGGGASC